MVVHSTSTVVVEDLLELHITFVQYSPQIYSMHDLLSNLIFGFYNDSKKERFGGLKERVSTLRKSSISPNKKKRLVKHNNVEQEGRVPCLEL